MQNTLPTPPPNTPQKPGATDILNNVIAMGQASSATNALQQPVTNKQAPQTQAQPASQNSANPDVETEKHFIDVFLETLTKSEESLYRHIRKEMLEKQKLSILMVTGELSYLFDFKGITIEFSLLNGADKYSVDQYQFGRDPLGVFKAANALQIAQRIQMYGETQSEAATSFLEAQSMDSVAKRTALITLALSIKLFNGKRLGDVSAAVAAIEKFQAPLIQKMSQVYNLFETVIMHILQDDNFLKN